MSHESDLKVRKIITAQDAATALPARVNSSGINKSSFGHVAVVGGCVGLIGAPILAAHAALRTGAGLVTVAFPKDLENSLASRLSPVIMTLSLKQAFEGTIASAGATEALELANRCTAVAFGPGLGKGAEITVFVQKFLEGCHVPVVVDADALNALAAMSDQGVSIIKTRKTATILTPHPKELARLLTVTTEVVQADREAVAKQATEKFGCVVVLKGHRTIVTSGEAITFENDTGHPGMATAGTGDVLTGILAAILAQHIEPLAAAKAAVHIHGLAGDLAATVIGGNTGMIATDLIEFLPRAIGECQRKSLNIPPSCDFP